MTTSPLNQKRFTVAVFVAIPSTARSGFQWFWVDPTSNIIGTPKLPLPSVHFHCALSYENDRVIHHWTPPATEQRPLQHPIGAAAPVPTNPDTQVSMNTTADALLQRLLRPRSTADLPTSTDDVPDTTAPPEEEEPDHLDAATSDAFGRLLTALNNPTNRRFHLR